MKLRKISLALLFILMFSMVSACSDVSNQSQAATTNDSVTTHNTKNVKGTTEVDYSSGPNHINYGKVSDYKPTAGLAESVMTPTVKSKLGGKVTYNGNGAFIVNNNTPNIAVKKTTPYISEPTLNKYHQLGAGIAVVNYSTYQFRTRTGGTIKPAGWHQMKLKGSHYSYLYNRGHSLGYAIIGNLKGFNSTEANPNNISTQTAWANQAEGGKEGDGQNYYENIVRNAIKAHKTVIYEVKPIYVGTNLVPVGSEIEAKGIGNSISFNVFVPNVEPGVSINYATGVAKVE